VVLSGLVVTVESWVFVSDWLELSPQAAMIMSVTTTAIHLLFILIVFV
jgi:hypothetical protein